MRDFSVTSAYLSPAQAAIMRKERGGAVAATGKYDAQVAQKLVNAGLLRHEHGLVYKTTRRGDEIVEQLRQLDAV